MELTVILDIRTVINRVGYLRLGFAHLLPDMSGSDVHSTLSYYMMYLLFAVLILHHSVSQRNEPGLIQGLGSSTSWEHPQKMRGLTQNYRSFTLF